MQFNSSGTASNDAFIEKIYFVVVKRTPMQIAFKINITGNLSHCFQPRILDVCHQKLKITNVLRKSPADNPILFHFYSLIRFSDTHDPP
jgi:hypothetical protein